jgi:UPF0755 protein
MSGFLSLLVIGSFGFLALLAYGSNRLQEPGPLQADKVIFITPRTDLPDIIDKLDAEGVIDSPFTLNAALTIERKRGKVKAGEYLFRQHVSLRSVIDALVSGKQILHPITIPEGLTSAQIVQRLRESDLLVGEIRVMPNEGALLPETYKVARGMTRADLLNLMEGDSRKAVEQIWARRSPDLPLQSPYELVTLASIVEKETGKADERPRVAGVFINRLKRRMRLQSDPTIVYGLVAGQGTLGHSITRAELDKKTPYNTYQIDGLPPGPIDNPGRAALEAVANPSRTQELYFVADGTGGHAFAGTIEDHNRNVSRWREIQREAKDKTDVDKLAPGALAPPPRGNQRSDASSVFGGLPASIGTVSSGHLAAFVDPQTRRDVAVLSAADVREPSSNTKRPPAAIDVTAMGTSLDQMGFSIGGSRPSASDILDGPVAADQEPPPPAAALAYAPMSAGAAAARPPHAADAKAALDATAPQGRVDLFADPNPASESAPTGPLKTPPAHPKIYDASEGTALDPLKDTSYDLNSGKSIPTEFVGK